MDRKPASGDGPGEDTADTTADGYSIDRDESQDAERFGPLDVTRLRKDDGRSLIHFTCERREP